MSIRTSNTRATISRREPVIALRVFRYLGRNYKEGSPLDRRRCRMSHGKLVRLIREGLCIMARDMNPEKLAEYGFIYTTESPRMKLTKVKNARQRTNDLLMKTYFPDEVERGESELTTHIDESALVEKEVEEVEENDSSPEATLKHVGGGWYDVMVDDKQINDDGMRKKDALELIKTIEEGV